MFQLYGLLSQSVNGYFDPFLGHKLVLYLAEQDKRLALNSLPLIKEGLDILSFFKQVLAYQPGNMP